MRVTSSIKEDRQTPTWYTSHALTLSVHTYHCTDCLPGLHTQPGASNLPRGLLDKQKEYTSLPPTPLTAIDEASVLIVDAFMNLLLFGSDGK